MTVDEMGRRPETVQKEESKFAHNGRPDNVAIVAALISFFLFCEKALLNSRQPWRMYLYVVTFKLQSVRQSFEFFAPIALSDDS
jgi:hypothetical protein